tara:strand:+ start:706 stop:885 length:180 start_codon:yes stop_codon:yes gene_type:complete
MDGATNRIYKWYPTLGFTNIYEKINHQEVFCILILGIRKGTKRNTEAGIKEVESLINFP